MEGNERHDGPTTGEVGKIVRAVAHGELTRRQFLERGLTLGVSVGALGAVLAACGGEAGPEASPSAWDRTKPEQLSIFNWSDYMSPQVLKDFEATHGIKVKESFYDGNEALLAKLKAGVTGYDVIFPTDMWVQVLSRSGLIMPLDMSLITNWHYVTQELFRKPPFDDPDKQDGKKYSVPYMFGSTGYVATLAKVPEPMDSWDQLWEAKYKGQIAMLDIPRETLGVGLIRLGYSSNTTSQEELDAAVEALIEQKPLVQRYDSVNTRRSIVQGLALTHCWDGDYGLAIKTIPPENAKYVLPSQGYMIWADGICVPKTANSPYWAHMFLNHMLDPKQAGQAADYIGYQCVVTEGVQYITNETQRKMRPTDEQIDNGQLPTDLGEFQRNIDDAWHAVKSA